VQANTFVCASAKGVVLIALALAALRIKCIGSAKTRSSRSVTKLGNHDVVAGAKLNAVKFGVSLADPIEIDKCVHAHKFVDRISNFAGDLLSTHQTTPDLGQDGE
jgi:hypothetical protein